MNISVSYVIPVLNSHEVVRRQILFWERMELPDDVEIIIMDDGSDPPLQFDTNVVKIHQTGETMAWTSSIARNRGAEIAKGRNLIMADVDYIIPKEVIMRVREFSGMRMPFRRAFGVLDENGQLTLEPKILFEYGLSPAYYRRRNGYIPPHPNVYAMRRDVFFAIGGYDEARVRSRPYPQGEDNNFKVKTRRWFDAHPCKLGDVVEAGERSTVYMFPNGQFCGDVDYNPFGLFHNLTRKTSSNVFYKRQTDGRGPL